MHKAVSAALLSDSTDTSGRGHALAAGYEAAAGYDAKAKQVTLIDDNVGSPPFSSEHTHDDANVAATAGYATEFSELYRKHFQFVWRSATGLSCGARVVLEDVVQDVWLVVHQRWSTFRGDSNERTWLFAITRNVVLNHKRRLRRKGGLEPLDEFNLPDTSSNQSEAQAVWNDVKLFLSCLDEPQREIFVSRYLLEMSPGEIADATGRNLVAVYAEARKLKSSFKRWLETQEGEP